MQQVKVCPLSKAANAPPAQRFLDMTDVMYNGLIPYDEPSSPVLRACSMRRRRSPSTSR